MSCIHINSLTVRGPVAALDSFIARNQSSYIDEDDGERRQMPLSFHALVPFPEELAIDWGGYAEAIYRVLYGTDEELQVNISVQSVGLADRASLLQYFTALAPEDRKLAERYHQNKQKYGHEAECSWYQETWGIQHDLTGVWLKTFFMNRVSPGEATYLFDTNWGVPDRWLMQVAPIFPELDITLGWECPEQATTGCIEYRHGRQVRFLQRDMWLRECDTDDEEDDPSPHGSCITEPEDQWPP